MVVQHNLRAMNSNRMLGLTQSQQAKSSEKLSSGYKINRAADDAAGLSISEKMRKQIRGLTQASLNAQDGISAVQTAEGAMHEVQDMLQRMNELAVKAANGTMSADDRGYIQDEIDQLITEIDRVAETTKFNETYLLKGDPEGTKHKRFLYKETEVTAEDYYFVNKDGSVGTLKKGTYTDAIDENIMYFKTDKPAAVGTAITTATQDTYFDATAVKVIDQDDLYRKDGDKYIKVAVGDEYTGTPGDYYQIAAGADGELGKATQLAAAPTTADRYKVTADVIYDKNGNPIAKDQLVETRTDYFSDKTTATLDKDDEIAVDDMKKENKYAQFVDKDGNEIAANGLYRYIDDNGKLIAGSGLYVKSDKITLAEQTDVDKMVDSTNSFEIGSLSFKLHVGADSTDNNQIALEISAMDSLTLGINNVKVNGADDDNALNAIETVKEAIQKISTQRSALGAVQNRLEHTINNLDNVVENTTAAESQIRDTDMATEMVKFSNNNILAQAGQAMLAQSNQANQGVLALLQ